MSVKEIVRFQTDRRLNDMPYDDLNEHTNIVEELLESLGLDVPKENRNGLQKLINGFVTKTMEEGVAIEVTDEAIPTEMVDAYADIIVFAIGAIMKLGFNPEKVLEEVAKEINSRVGTMVNGKFEKDLSDEAKANWYKADYTVAKETK